MIGHISRDSTAIDAREKALKKPKKQRKAPRKRGRPKGGEAPTPKELTRLEKQKTMSVNLIRMRLNDTKNDPQPSESMRG